MEEQVTIIIGDRSIEFYAESPAGCRRQSVPRRLGELVTIECSAESRFDLDIRPLRQASDFR